uniref:CUB domain-containing protein n=1 Tax=Anopheles farauti TaxID=69004 RepID=A0A182QVT1_9DIPT
MRRRQVRKVRALPARMSVHGCLWIVLFGANVLAGLLVQVLGAGGEVAATNPTALLPKLPIALPTTETRPSGAPHRYRPAANIAETGESGPAKGTLDGGSDAFVAADIINLDRDGAVSFIPRRDVRYQRAVPPEYAGASALPHCETFTMGDPDSKTLYNPGWPGNYPNNSDCVVVLEAPVGFLVRLDFRDHFHVEPSEECKYDFLEIRDGAHGFSTLIGKYCGQTYPPMITSKERFLWLHFHSDENIEYNGFVVVYDYVPRPTSSIYDDESCRMEVSGMEGFVNRSDVPREKQQTVIEHGLSLDCMWVVTVADGWKIQLSFLKFKLERPNDCESNFVDVFTERTDLPSRLKNFCGSIADSVVSRSNVLHIRFFAEAAAINSTFSILFTAFREKAAGETCDDNEYDCEDATCIDGELRCNGRINCRFRWDEDECQKQTAAQSEHVIIIVIVFGLILGGMILLFLFNCSRKIIRDHKIIREHIRQSRESKLNELGRHSTKKLVDLDITKLPPPAFDKDPCNVLESSSATNVNNGQYYRDTMGIGSVGGGSAGSDGANVGPHMFSSRIDIKAEPQDILRGSYHDDPLSRSGTLGRDGGGMCDMACQTRESLFQPVFKNKVNQSPNQLQNSIRFSTFGYESQQHQEQQQLPAVTPPPPRVKHHHHHHHHHHGGGTLEGGGKSSKVNRIELEDLSPPGSGGYDVRGDDLALQQQHQQQQQQHGHSHTHTHTHQHQHPHAHQKIGHDRNLTDGTGVPPGRPGGGGGSGGGSYGHADIRKSAPDVIIMTSSH